jgi:polysaccharide pyruvyl transferase WcaK-like protein
VQYLLVGNYGVGNVGDEALRGYFLRVFPEVRWRVLSHNPVQDELPRVPTGPRSLLLTPWWRTLFALRKADGMVFGGGSLFTDIESSRACFLWWCHAFVAWIFHKPYLLAFQGIGPFRTRRGEWLARWTLRHAGFVSVRDEASEKQVGLFDMNKQVIQTFDPVFLLMLRENSPLCSQNLLVIIPRNNSDANFFRRATELFREGKWDRISILSLKPDDPVERKVCEDLRSAIGPGASIITVRNLEDLLREISPAAFVLSQRYHGALAALALRKRLEVVPQGEGDKLSAFLVPRSVQVLRDLVKAGEEALRQSLLCH